MFSVQLKQRCMDYAEADTSQLGLNLEKANLSPKKGKSNKTSRPKHEHDKKHSGRCKYCCDSHKKGQCPATYGHRCTYCSKEHHFESVCLTKARNAAKPNNIRGVDYDDMPEQENPMLGTMHIPP